MISLMVLPPSYFFSPATTTTTKSDQEEEEKVHAINAANIFMTRLLQQMDGKMVDAAHMLPKGRRRLMSSDDDLLTRIKRSGSKGD